MNKYRVMFSGSTIVESDNAFEAIEKVCKERGWEVTPYSSDLSGGAKWASGFVETDDRSINRLIDAVIEN